MLNIPGYKVNQIRTSLGFHLTLVRMATIKNTNNNVSEDVGKKEPSYIAGGNTN
jgi:hypothetical protein